MTEQDAIKVYLSKKKQLRHTIKLLTLWDENKTIRENAVYLFASNVATATHFKLYWGLRSVSIRNRLPRKKTLTTKAYAILRNSGWTYTNIATAFGKSRQAIEDGLSRRDFVINKEDK